MSGARGIPTGVIDSAPTPQNTPAAHLSVSQFSKPQVPDTIGENDDEEEQDYPTGNALANAQASELATHPLLMSVVQNRLNGLVGRSSGYLEALPPAIRTRVDGLQGIQVEHAKIEADFQMDVLELEKRYVERYRPLYERRLAIVTGKVEPTGQEIEAGVKSELDDASDDEEEEKEPRQPATAEDIASSAKGIPGFWFTALSNHLGISDLITERDEGALKHLVDIQSSYLTERPGFKLTFVFGAGAKDFFDNETLEKTYYYQAEVGYGGDFLYEKAEGTDIKWKEGKDLTIKIESKKQRNKNTNQTRIVKKAVPTESFFTFFKPPVPPTDDDDMADEEQDDIEEKLELDYQIGEDIKERIVPRAVDFFTGKAIRFEGGGDDEFSDDFEDESDEDDDDDDDDEPMEARKSKKGLQPPASGVTPASAQPSECQQQ